MKRQICHVEKCHIIYIATLKSRKWGINFLVLSWKLHIMTSFQRVQYGKGKEQDNFPVEEPGKHSLSQVIKVSINNMSY